MWFTENNGSKVGRITLGGTITEFVVGSGPKGITTGPDGALWFVENTANKIGQLKTDGTYETLVHDPRVLWPDTLSLATDGYLYFTANQLHLQARFHHGKDLRQRPYSLFRIRVDARPVLLR